MAEPARPAPEHQPRPLAATRRGTPVLLGRFDDRAQAREAMVALQNSGIDGEDVGLVGDRASRTSRRSSRRRPDPADREIAGHLVTRSLAESARIGALGGAAGLLVGGILWAVTGSWVLLPVAVVALGVIASVVGAMVGVERSTGLSDSWELTFHHGERGSLWVAVYSGDPDRARSLLTDQGATDIRRPTDLDKLGSFFEGVDTGRRPA